MTTKLRVALALTLLSGCEAPEDDAPSAAPVGGKADEIGERPIVETLDGAVQGRREGHNDVFRGIPYAAPPVGDLRWRAPQPPTAWHGVRDAGEFGSSCIQVTTDPTNPEVIRGSEDCLTLNVWAPADAAAASLPVMVFIHGGYFWSGSSSDTLGRTAIYSGHALAERGDAVVVTINYRLGALGFLANRELVAEDEDRLAGNYGLLDQIAALSWVRDNIDAFGGDADRVMVFGESAGGHSVCYLMTSPRAPGLFSRAAIQSGACYAVPRADALDAGDRLARRLGCAHASNVARCLRRADPLDAATALPPDISAGGYWFAPNIDASVLPQQPRKTIRMGDHASVPMMIGTNRDEYTTLLADTVPWPIVTRGDYRAAVRDQFGAAWAEVILAEYPADDYATPERAFVELMGDYSLHCQARDIARLASARPDHPVWRYEYAYRFADPPLRRYGAAHGFELIGLFGVFDEPSFPAGPSAADRDLSNTIMDYWTRFAATGDPNDEGAAPWSRYDASRDPVLELGRASSTIEAPRRQKCDFWDAQYSG